MTHRTANQFAALYVIYMLVAAVSSLVLASACADLGVQDPAVADVNMDLTHTLLMINEDADSLGLVQDYLNLATAQVSKYEALNDKLTDLDKLKIKRIKEGLVSLAENIDNEDYLRVRSFSLAQLALSVGMYSQEGLKKLKEMLKQLQGDDTDNTPADNKD